MLGSLVWGRLEADHSGVTVWQVVDRGGWWGLNGFGYRRPYFQEGDCGTGIEDLIAGRGIGLGLGL